MERTENEQKIRSAYEELKGLLSSIEDHGGDWFDDNDFSTHADSVIGRIGDVCPEIEDIKSYKTMVKYSEGRRGNVVKVIQTRSRYKTLLGRMKGLYDLNDDQSFVNGSDNSLSSKGVNVSVNQSQSQSQTLSIVLDLQETIIQEIPKYKEGSKERNFLEKIKDLLVTIKDARDIISIIINTAAQFGLTAAAVAKVLNL